MTDTTVESLVRDSAAPLAAVELPSGRFLAVNPPLAKMLGSTVAALTGSSSLDQLARANGTPPNWASSRWPTVT